MAPNIAMSIAPPQTRIVPTKEYRVKGSLRMSVAQMELKTKPDYQNFNKHPTIYKLIEHTACRVDRTGSGSVVIWMVLPTTLETTNMSMPNLIWKSADNPIR